MSSSVFADTVYWQALAHNGDQHHQKALDAEGKIGGRHIVTTDAVLVEVANALSGKGAYLRVAAASIIRRLLTRDDVTVPPVGPTAHPHPNFAQNSRTTPARWLSSRIHTCSWISAGTLP